MKCLMWKDCLKHLSAMQNASMLFIVNRLQFFHNLWKNLRKKIFHSLWKGYILICSQFLGDITAIL